MHSKRYQAAKTLVEVGKTYSLTEAVALVKQTASTKFDGSIEIHIRLGIDPTKGDQAVRGTVELPHGSGKKVRVAVIAKGPAAKAAKDAGADIVGDDDLIAEIKKNESIAADVVIATPDMMKLLAPVAKILGTKGLMPNPKNDTVTADPGKAVAAWQKGKVPFRSDNTANVHAIIGKPSFSPEQLETNITAFMEAVKKVKPTTMKGTYIKSITMAASMGPGIKVAF